MIDLKTAKVIAAVVRNGKLTNSETRFEYDLTDYNAQVAVLVVLPRSDTPRMIDRDVLVQAASQIVESVRDVFGDDSVYIRTKADGCEDC